MREDNIVIAFGNAKCLHNMSSDYIGNLLGRCICTVCPSITSRHISNIHRILPCNEWLYVRKVVTSVKCTYKLCDSLSIDSIILYLITCLPVATCWQYSFTWWNKLENDMLEKTTLLVFLVYHRQITTTPYLSVQKYTLFVLISWF
jgi:hypothetical protein